MSKVLYIKANPKDKGNSNSLLVSDKFIEEYKINNPKDEIKELDLYGMEIPLIDREVFNAWDRLAKGEELTVSQNEKLALMNNILEEFVEADKYVFSTPLWNFTVPPKMKAYLDNVCVAGKTFKYTEKGPQGLLEGKKALHVQARGGVFSEGPAKELEMGDKYIKTIMAFIGVNNYNSIILEGLNYYVDKVEEIKGKALNEATELAKEF